MERMSVTYPELRTGFDRISQVAYAEEEAFRRTLASGTTILDTAVARVKSAGPGTPNHRPELTGSQAFALHDTYGFPIDLTLEMAAEQGVAVDEAGFRRLMQEQRDRARADAKARKQGHVDTSVYRRIADGLGRAVEFTGYDEVVSEGRGRRDRAATARRSRPPDPATTSSWSWTAPRSTRRAVGSWPTAAGSSWTTAPSSRCDDVQSPDRRGRHAPGDRGPRRGRPGRPGPLRGRHRAPQVDLPRRTRGRTWCTRRFARPSATPRPRRVRRTRPAASGSTSTPSPRCPSRCCVTSRPRSTRCCSTTCR